MKQEIQNTIRCEQTLVSPRRTSLRLLRCLLLLVLLLTGKAGAWGEDVTIANVDFSNPIIKQVVDGSVNSMSIGTHANNPTTINSDGRLVLGNTTNRVVIPESQREGNTVTISFDLAFGKLLNRYVNFYLKDIDENSIGSFSFCPYTGNSTLSTNLGIEADNMYFGSNTIIWDRRVSFIITLNYSTNEITTRTLCDKDGNGTQETDATHTVTMTNTNRFAIFEVGSDYDNADRYCQFDNLLIKTNTTDYYSYKLKSNLGTVIATGTEEKNNSVTLPYPEFELSGTDLYLTEKNSSDYYRKTVAVNNPDGICQILTYTKNKENVIFYTEAENIVGATAKTTNNAPIRCSNGKGAAFSAETDITTLFSGRYKIWGQVWGTAGDNFIISANSTELWSCTTDGNLTSKISSDFFTLNTLSTLKINAKGSDNRMLDCLYIQADNISFPVTSGTISQHSTETVTVYNASSSTTYTSSDETVATVTSNGNGTINITSLGKNGTATITATENGKTATYVVTVERGTLAFAEATRTAYLEDLTYQYEANSSATAAITYSVSSGDGAAVIDNASTGVLRLIKPGNVTISANDARNFDPAPSYTLTVSTRQTLTASSLTNGQTFDVGTQVGQLTDESVTIGGTTLYFGANATDNSKDEKQVVRSIRGNYGITCLDVNGYTHSNIANFAIGSGDQWGTYYRIDTGSEVNTIIITGYFADDVTHLYLYDITGKKLATLYNTGANLASIVMDGKLLAANTTYYLMAPGTVFALKSFTHTNVRATLDYGESYKGVVFCNDDLAAPTLTITDAGGNNIASHYTKGAFTSSKTTIATVNSTTGALTASATKGRTIITLPLTSDTPGTYPHLIVTDTIDVTDGKWDFRQYDRDHGCYYMFGSPGWTGGWNDRNMPRDNQFFDFILMNQEFTERTPDYVSSQYGEPLPLATGLRTRYKHRLIYSGDHLSDRTGGYLHLQGSGIAGASRYGHGGEVMIPVKNEMLVEINCWSDGLLSEMEIEGATDMEGNDISAFYVNNGAAQTFRFLAKDDGYIYVRNISTNLDLYINYIQVSSSLAFEHGNETYVQAGGGSFFNSVANLGTATITSYSVSNTTNAPTNSISSSGVVELNGSYGIFEVTATADDGRTGKYTATSLAFEVQDHEEALSADSKTFNLNEAIKTLNTGNTFGADPSDEKTTAENNIKSKIVFSIESSTTTATLSGTSLTIEGAGTVSLKAKLGAIIQTFTYTISGGALGYNDGVTDIACAHPVISNNAESYTIKIIGASTSEHKFKVKQMYDAIIGTNLIANKSGLKFYKDGDVEIASPSTTTEVESQTLKITGFNTIESSVGPQFGGVIPIYASYEYNSSPHNLTGTLTVAYSQHIWNFENNMIKDLADWYVDKSANEKKGKWKSTATFDMPTDDDDATFATGTASGQSHYTEHDWKFVRKIGSTHPESAIIYYYNHNVDNSNALVIPQTEGLHISSTKNGQQLGVEMDCERVTRKPNGKTERYSDGWGMAVAHTDDGERYVEYPIVVNNVVTNTGDAGRFIYDKDGNESCTDQYLTNDVDKEYKCSNLMVKRGGRITIPKLKKGQWVEMRWTRHKEDMAERVLMENLSDFEGTPITGTYKIGNCFYDLSWSTSTYMFQATEAGDVTFEIADNIYISIQQIELHEPSWDPVSSIVSQLSGYDDVSSNPAVLDDKLYKDYTAAERAANWTAASAPKVDWQYIWDDQNEHTVTLLVKQYQNAPNAPQTWTCEMDEMLRRSGAEMQFTGDMNSDATLTYKGGWGKVTVTMTSYSQNMKYVANKKSWTITFGQAPRQTYPYTWDFTKYFNNTKSNIGTDSWNTAGDTKTAIYPNYNTQNYTQSYYVEGAQLVSYALRNNNNNGVLPETDGLGFKLDTNSDNAPDATLNLNMANGDLESGGMGAEQNAGTSYRTWKTTGSLSIGAGGKVIVPKPGDGFTGFYIYIKSSVEPTSYNTVVKKMVSSGATETQENDPNYDVAGNVYKYHFQENDHAEFTFGSATDIYAIAVTNEFKPMKPLSQTAWATESRSHAVDYTLDSLLTVNPVHAYAIISRSSNPLYSDNKTKTVVAINDQRYVVPANNGLVIKQTQRYNGAAYADIAADAVDYSVPLFKPAVTTAEDAAYRFENNLMRPCVEGKTFAAETENFDGTDGTDYTVFILTNRYMTWRKDGDAPATYDASFTTGNVASFYRLHLYGNDSYDGGTSRNTLGANKAYLLLPTSRIAAPVWDASSPARRYDYVGILGVSDMDEAGTPDTERPDDNRTYDLRGRLLDDTLPLQPGIYIRNGKKIIVR